MNLQMIFVVAMVTMVTMASCASVSSSKRTSNRLAPFHCDEKKSEKCFSEYADHIGYSGAPANASEFIEYVYRYLYDNGKDGFSSLCVADGLLQFCLGVEYDNCSSVRGLTESGLDQADAAEYAFFLASEQYYCGKGFDVYYQNFQCLQEVLHSQRHQHEDERCRKTFHDNVQHNHDLFCEYAQEFVSCLSNPYKVCGSPLVRGFCNSLKASFDKLNPRCSYLLSCKAY